MHRLLLTGVGLVLVLYLLPANTARRVVAPYGQQ